MGGAEERRETASSGKLEDWVGTREEVSKADCAILVPNWPGSPLRVSSNASASVVITILPPRAPRRGSSGHEKSRTPWRHSPAREVSPDRQPPTMVTVVWDAGCT